MTRRLGETSYKETAFGIIPRSKLVPLEIEGIKRAWNFILKHGAKKQLPLTVQFVKKLHEVGFGWIFPKDSGKFRLVDVQVSRHAPPKASLIQSLMLDFTRDLKMRLHYLVRTDDPGFLEQLVALLSWAHHRFLWIHPFFDYNGRIARLLINIILLNLDLPPIDLKIETLKARQRYIHALQMADGGNDTLLQQMIMEAVKEAVRSLK